MAAYAWMKLRSERMALVRVPWHHDPWQTRDFEADQHGFECVALRRPEASAPVITWELRVYGFTNHWFKNRRYTLDVYVRSGTKPPTPDEVVLAYDESMRLEFGIQEDIVDLLVRRHDEMVPPERSGRGEGIVAHAFAHTDDIRRRARAYITDSEARQVIRLIGGVAITDSYCPEPRVAVAWALLQLDRCLLHEDCRNHPEMGRDCRVRHGERTRTSERDEVTGDRAIDPVR